jgi:two-component system, OmpR family, response regulator
MSNILIVEDNFNLASSLTQGLCEQGYPARAVYRGADAISVLDEALRVDLVVLDLGLPDMDGLAVLQHVRRRANHVPILVLTARDALDMRVAALGAGADDYMVKPFAFAELVARVHALTRRATGPRWAPMRLGALSIDDDLVVRAAGCEVNLSPREHALLSYLARRRGEVAQRAEILAAVFGYDFDPGTNVIDVHIASLRRKLGALPVLIHTVRGSGFKLDVEAL